VFSLVCQLSFLLAWGQAGNDQLRAVPETLMSQSADKDLNGQALVRLDASTLEPKEWAILYDFRGQTAVVTGGTGVLGGEIACALAALGASVAILGRNLEAGSAVRQRMGARSGNAEVFLCDVLEPESVQKAASNVQHRFGRVDCLINAAGGNNPKATTIPGQNFFDLAPDALRSVFELNILGTILPCQTFGKIMAHQGRGVILNVSSMAAVRPLTRVVAYSAAKAALNNFTQWLAVHMAQECSPNIRVNAIAPGFFQTHQNRFLLTDQNTGELTARGKSIISHTPMGRFGNPGDLLGAALWLLSPASSFVTGVVIPIDGGFSAFGGV
jgi:NAD(P)-dependent dehydrogenase (short-subunit alcohol dehydrogenase family)